MNLNMKTSNLKKALQTVIFIILVGCAGSSNMGPHRGFRPDIDSLFDVACRSSSIERIISYTSQAIREDSTCVDCYLLRAVSWLRIGQLDEAYADTRRAAYIDPTLFPAVKELHMGSYSYGSLIDEFKALYKGMSDCDCVNRTIFSDKYAGLSNHFQKSREFENRRGWKQSDLAEKIAVKSNFNRERTAASNSTFAAHDGKKNKDSKQIDINSSGAISTEVPGSEKNTTTKEDDAQIEHKDGGEKTARNGVGGTDVLDSLTCTIEQARQSKDPGIYLCVVRRLYKQKNYKEVLSVSREALRLQKKSGEMHLLRAKTFGARHRYRKALRSVNKAIRFNSEESSYYLVQAWIYHCLGKFKKERNSLHTALRLGSDKRSIIELRLESIADK